MHEPVADNPLRPSRRVRRAMKHDVFWLDARELRNLTDAAQTEGAARTKRTAPEREAG